MPRRRAPRLPSVLVVDDFPDGRELVAEYLTFRGFTVHTATDGEQAIQVARSVRPDIVLMDLSMPGIDGWEAARTLKADPRTRDIIVLAVTAHAMKPETDAARSAGCDGIICKPFDITTLGNALPRLLTHGAKVLDVPGLSLTARASARRAAVDGQPRGVTPRNVRTAMPDTPPPLLQCPTCQRALVYRETVMSGGGVRDRLDYFDCSACGRYEYRHRTRTLRRAS